jgi:hypothetical protein
MFALKMSEERGQTMVLVAFGIITLIAFVGLAVDLGLAYVERIRVRRAADAAALAAAVELPLEETAHVRALEYLEENEYGCGLTYDASAGWYRCTQNDTVRVEVNGTHVAGPAEGEAERVLRINTADYRYEGQVNSADRVRVEIVEDAPVFFMRVLGFMRVPVPGTAVAENIEKLDVALVFDKSVSMQFNTLCYGCWTPSATESYPAGNLHPLPWDGDDDDQPDQCEGNEPLIYAHEAMTHTYTIIEAEEYGQSNSPYDRDLSTPGYSFWVIQRNGGYWMDPAELPDYMGYAGAFGRDDYGGYISHMPLKDVTQGTEGGTAFPCTWDDLQNGRICNRSNLVQSYGGPFPAPRVDYEFTVPDGFGTNWYIWIRGQGGDPAYTPEGKYVHWGLDGSPQGEGTVEGASGYLNGATAGAWEWTRLCRRSGGCTHTLAPGSTHTLNLWGGAVSFDVDRIVITDNPDADPEAQVMNEVFRRAYFDNNRTGLACDPCDPRFGGSSSPTDGRPYCDFTMNDEPFEPYQDDIYDDEQPLRSSLEAAKTFVRRMDPRFDQVAYVRYDERAEIVDKLQCLRRLGLTQCAGDWDETSDFSSDVIENSVIQHLDATQADDGFDGGSGTNIAEAIKLGIDVLSNEVVDGEQQYGRPSAAHIMILLTDGEANTNAGTDAACDDEDLWSDGGPAKDCVVYYAREARDRGIVIYPITLGQGADIELMSHVAEITGGVHRHAPRASQLNDIFLELFERIFLRLVE